MWDDDLYFNSTKLSPVKKKKRKQKQDSFDKENNHERSPQKSRKKSSMPQQNYCINLQPVVNERDNSLDTQEDQQIIQVKEQNAQQMLQGRNKMTFKIKGLKKSYKHTNLNKIEKAIPNYFQPIQCQREKLKIDLKSIAINHYRKKQFTLTRQQSKTARLQVHELPRQEEYVDKIQRLKLFNKKIQKYKKKALFNSSYIPTLISKSYTVYDMLKKEFVVSKKDHRKRPIGSLTKLMTAYLVFKLAEKYHLNMWKKLLVVDKESLDRRSILEEGDRLKIIDLVYAMMYSDSNTPAKTLTKFFGAIILRAARQLQKNPKQFEKECERVFILQMNKEAFKLNMFSTSYATCDGVVNKTNVSTAYDQAFLCIAALENNLMKKLFQNTEYHCQVYQYGGTRRSISWQNNINYLQKYGFQVLSANNSAMRSSSLEDQFLAAYYESKKDQIVLILLGCKSKESRNTEARVLVQYCKHLRRNKKQLQRNATKTKDDKKLFRRKCASSTRNQRKRHELSTFKRSKLKRPMSTLRRPKSIRKRPMSTINGSGISSVRRSRGPSTAKGRRKGSFTQRQMRSRLSGQRLQDALKDIDIMDTVIGDGPLPVQRGPLQRQLQQRFKNRIRQRKRIKTIAIESPTKMFKRTRIIRRKEKSLQLNVQNL